MSSAVLNSNGMSAHLGIVQFKEELRRLKREAIDDLSHKMDDLIGKADQPSALDVLQKASLNKSSPVRRRKKGELPEKEFHLQNSVLTDLFQSKHIQTIENMTVAALIVWIIVASTTDAFDKRNWRAVIPNLDVIGRAFANFQTAISFWLFMFLYSLLIYPLTYFWSCFRPSGPKGWFDVTFQTIFAGVLMLFFWLPIGYFFSDAILGPAAAATIGAEKLRMTMKMYAFVREATKQVFRAEECLAKKNDGDAIDTSVVIPRYPGFSHYLYFLFAPTLIYRDAYPRNETVNWNYVCSNFFQFFGCLILMYYVVQRYLIPEFSGFSQEPMSLEAIVKGTFRCTVPGVLVLMMMFFSFLHSWLNAWAEMLRFGDRMFYKDWWNTMSYSGYYRTWNCVVHDFLYVYIYKETMDHFKFPRKWMAALIVFTLSSGFHEYVIASSLGFFYPVLQIEFGVIGFVFFFFNGQSRICNVLIWVTLTIGMGLMLSLYSFEVSARTNCPQTLDDFTDSFIPRSWTCVEWNWSRFNYTE